MANESGVQAVIVERAADLLPFDMVDEGLFVSEINFPGGWVVRPCCYVEEPFDGVMVKRPVWGEEVDQPMTFPVTVMRGVHLPRCELDPTDRPR